MSKRHKYNAKRENAAIVRVQDPNARTPGNVLNFQRPVGNAIGEKRASPNVTPVRTASTQAVGSPPVHAETVIRRRAYELYEKRGCQDGHAEEDWLQAEKEILGTVFRRARTDDAGIWNDAD